ncbi:CPS_collapsed_G0048640.mRNA.1.CDS.1 [Saccharomyces cerevisiae]|nr:CPS_collapsed_G0048640.mRNA.1.CDS.1 [Saccharomyces cerevisiae]
MESPNMTFATPTLIAHDRSNIDVIAHELAHSWSGNLVTNCWTVYLERRIIGAIHGEPTRHFSALIGWSDLQNSIDSMKDPERFFHFGTKLER